MACSRAFEGSERVKLTRRQNQTQELLALWRQDKEAMAPGPVHDGPGDAKRHRGENGNGGAAE